MRFKFSFAKHPFLKRDVKKTITFKIKKFESIFLLKQMKNFKNDSFLSLKKNLKALKALNLAKPTLVILKLFSFAK